MSTPSIFGQYLKLIRKKSCSKQQVLADALKCSLQAVSNWESGRFIPDPRKLPAIASALKLSAEEKIGLRAALERELVRRGMDEHVSKQVSTVGFQSLLVYGPRTVPLLRRRNTVNPIALLKKGKRAGVWVARPTDLQSEFVGAYLQEDMSMAPLFKPNDQVFFDMLLKPLSGKATVVCIERQTYCRLLQHEGDRLVFRPLSTECNVITVAPRQVKWCYPVVARMSYFPDGAK